ncbi:phytanoyl-CoA dioxygenase family protein [Pelagibius litoralis]|uniref:Phytanoyl-CoA dioxygenase family protein n=1 Tax=Pelagibius litoralis TaxID=374515 RepID=A0A967F0F9_9PROT|nr:phytanoyl-CoA dioxygenase family protein [Pelagibius litoralis]NIA70805.1 phytanoyl-CoA dioxygenase family protein [Pelagibius litoralis]
MPNILSPAQRAAYDADGYVIVRNFFDSEEATLLKQAMERDPAISSHFYNRGDREGAVTKMALWNHPGDSVYGMAARCERMVDTMEDLLGGEVYHYHSKLTAKEPFEGGAWEWHQDYGYWYHNGCLFPLMASAMIALDRSTRENGCLQVLKGSHHLGRIEHGLLEGDQVGADLSRVEEAQKQLETVYAEMEPGDVLLFHCNTLHRSDQNRSAMRRWTMICCFNAARNDPYREHHHPRYTPLEKVPDSAIKAAGLKFAAEVDEAAFMVEAVAPSDLPQEGSIEEHG